LKSLENCSLPGEGGSTSPWRGGKRGKGDSSTMEKKKPCPHFEQKKEKEKKVQMEG